MTPCQAYFVAAGVSDDISVQIDEKRNGGDDQAISKYRRVFAPDQLLYFVVIYIHGQSRNSLILKVILPIIWGVAQGDCHAPE